MKAVIVDDNINFRTSLKEDLKVYCPGVHVIGEAASVKNAVELIQKLSPDVVFLDIDLEDGNGFEVLDSIDQKSFFTVFITAHNDFAIKAFKFSALDYLLKPVDPDELTEVYNKLQNQEKLEHVKNFIKVFQENNTQGKPNKIVLSTSNGHFVYSVDEIIRCEADRNYTKFYFTENSPQYVSKNLGEYEDMLGVHDFIRPHQSHLVNLHMIKKFIGNDSGGGEIELIDGTIIPIARRKKSELLNRLNSI